MGILQNFVTSLHQSTKRDYLARMIDNKVECMKIAKQFGRDYWDGDRRFGYGGYNYLSGRWKLVAEALIDTYQLTSGSKILDVGCGKGFLLHEMLLLEPDLIIRGIDISEYGIKCSTSDTREYLYSHRAQDQYPYFDKEFDLVISLGVIHNLRLFDIKLALNEIERVGKQGYVMVESYRNEQELFNLQCWALTCETFFDKEEWIWFFKHCEYKGDYEFIYFE
jgi:ubiquinone/menaquinone biosynthesis C-methylase UbiE